MVGQLRLEERRRDEPWGERKPGFIQENAWRRRQPSKWTGNEKEMPEIHERIGPAKLHFLFPSMSFRKGWRKSGKTGNRYFHSPLVPGLEAAKGLFLPFFLSPLLFSQQTKSWISLLLGFLDLVMPVKSCYFLLEQGLTFFVSPVLSQMESLIPRMPGLCQYFTKYDAFKSNTLLGWNTVSFHIYIRYLFPHESLLPQLKPNYLNFASSGKGLIKTIFVIFNFTNWSWKSLWRGRNGLYLAENCQAHDKTDKHRVFKEQWDIG